MRLKSSQNTNSFIRLHTSIEKMQITILSTNMFYTFSICAVIDFLKVDHFIIWKQNFWLFQNQTSSIHLDKIVPRFL